MKNRNVFAVFALPFVTFGIYSLVWIVKTKTEMNKLGAQIPTAQLIIIPIVNIWWYWKYSEGVEQITNEKLSTPIAFLLLCLLGSVGCAVVQNDFNNLTAAPVAMTPPQSFGNPQPIAPQNTAPIYNQPVESAPVVPEVATTTEPTFVQPENNEVAAEVNLPEPENLESNMSDFSSSDSSSES